MRIKLDSINLSNTKKEIGKAIALFTLYGTYKCISDRDFVEKDSNLAKRVIYTTCSVMFNSVWMLPLYYYITN